MVVHLAETLDVPLADRNRLLTAAGFAPMWQSRDLATPEMAPVHDAMRWTLDRHNPYPAVVMDRHWSVLYENQAATMMFDLLGLERPVDFLTEMTQPDGVRQIIDNWAEVGRYLLGRLRTESVAIGGDEQLDAAIDLLRADPEVGPPVSAQPPFVTLDFRLDDLCLSLLSTIAQFGTAEDLTLSEARIELFFPADDATREFLESLAS